MSSRTASLPAPDGADITTNKGFPSGMCGRSSGIFTSFIASQAWSHKTWDCSQRWRNVGEASRFLVFGFAVHAGLAVALRALFFQRVRNLARAVRPQGAAHHCHERV